MSRGAADPVIRELLERNRLWVRGRLEEDPAFFARLAQGQDPDVLFIGCCDSRKCLNTMTGTLPGQLFIHRNIGNQAPVDDANVQSVLEYAIHNLKVRHIIVAGHTRCGGVTAAMEGYAQGVVGDWIAPIRELAARHAEELAAILGSRDRADRLAELNVGVQVGNVRRSPAFVEGLRQGIAPRLHGWMFQLETGHIRELELPEEG